MIPQAHGSKWTQEETDFVKESISKGATLEDIIKVISLRTRGAILNKANTLEYGNYHNKEDNLTYFKETINHKVRRKKDDTKVNKNVSSPLVQEIDTIDVVDAEIIPKNEINISCYKGSTEFILKSIEDNSCLHL
ncbi:MAG: hypothetical protein U9N11_06520 [Campylobacterota bacterium]|nr:hypothetical protein [Campylobacterota bacterium]